jgi:hypothetical protein
VRAELHEHPRLPSSDKGRGGTGEQTIQAMIALKSHRILNDLLAL